MVSKKTPWVHPFLATGFLFAASSMPATVSAAENQLSNPEATPSTSITESQNESKENNDSVSKDVGFKFPEFYTCPSQPMEPIRYQAVQSKEKGPIKVYSDQAIREGDTAHLTGNVVVSQDGQQLTANSLTADNLSQSYKAEGDLLFTNQNFVVGADYLTYQAVEGSTEISNTRFHLYSNNGNGSAETITIEDRKSVV